MKNSRMFKKFISALCAVILVLTSGVFALAADDILVPNNALFHNGSPSAIIKTGEKSFLIADVFNRAIWSLKEGEEPVLLAGRISLKDPNGRPVTGYNDSTLLDSAFASPWDIVPFLKGYLISDTDNNALRFIDIEKKTVKTAAGNGKAGYKDGFGMDSAFDMPTGLAADENGNVYIADTGNSLIRKLSSDGNITTFAGTGEGYKDGAATASAFRYPTGLCYKNGALYIADTGNHLIRKIEKGMVTTVAGTAFPKDSDAYEGGGYVDGVPSLSEFSAPEGVEVSNDGTIYVSDTGNSVIRKITAAAVSTMLLSDVTEGETYPVSPRGLLIDKDNLYITDTFAGVVYNPVSKDAKTIPVNPHDIKYKDVPEDAWFYETVKYVSRKGLILGMESDMFYPDAKISRGMAVTVLGRFYALQRPDEKITGKNIFSDVSESDYFYDYVSFAYEKGIVNGTGDNNFSPNENITRQDFAVMLYRYAKFIGFNTEHNEDLSHFSDADKISPYAKEAIEWAVTWGILVGNEGISPQGITSRAEAATIFERFGKLTGI